MKFLISNYSTPWNTEPFYINAALLAAGQKCKIFNIQQSSIYDEFDSFNPDVLVTHISHLSKDIIHYVLNNQNKLSLFVNVNNVETSKLEEFANSLNDRKINITFFGDQDIKLTNNNYIKLMSSADIFLNNTGVKYSIQKLIFVDKEKDIVELNGTYHYTSCNQNLIDKVDFVLPINIMCTLFSNYKEIIFTGEAYIGSQISFNAIYSGTKVIFDTKESNSLEKINDIFKGAKLLSSVKNKHTCLHRTKSLFSSLNSKEINDSLEREIEKL